MKKAKRPQPLDIEVGRLVRLRRLSLDMSQTDLADRIGVTFQQVQKYEKGVNRIGASRLQQIATALEVPVSYFFGDASRRSGKPASEMLELVQSPQSLRLLRAFARIKSPSTQHSLLALAEIIAGDGDNRR